MIEASQIKTLIASVGALLYDTEIAREGGRTIYRVYIDGANGVDVELCARVSRLLSPLFDTDPPVKGEYVLEVSSPGIERKLRLFEHFVAAIGKPVKITLKDKTRVKGVLISASDGFVAIEGAESPIAFEQIAKAHILFS